MQPSPGRREQGGHRYPWDLCAMAAAVTARAGAQQADGSNRARVRAAGAGPADGLREALAGTVTDLRLLRERGGSWCCHRSWCASLLGAGLFTALHHSCHPDRNKKEGYIPSATALPTVGPEITNNTKHARPNSVPPLPQPALRA